MDFFSSNILLIMFMPAWAIIIIISSVIFNMSVNRKMTAAITLFSTFIGLLFAAVLFYYVRFPNTLIIEKNFLWLPFENLNLYLGSILDAYSTAFLLLFMLISFAFQLISYKYMKDKVAFSRYYIYLNFLNFSVIGFLLASNLFQMYIFAELTSIATCLLIGLYNKQEAMSSAIKRLFVINKISDCAFLAALIILIGFSVYYLNDLNTDFIFFSRLNSFENLLAGSAYPNIFNVVSFLFIFSAFLKSTQTPIQIFIKRMHKNIFLLNSLLYSFIMLYLGIYLILRVFPVLTHQWILYVIISAIVTIYITIGQTKTMVSVLYKSFERFFSNMSGFVNIIEKRIFENIEIKIDKFFKNVSNLLMESQNKEVQNSFRYLFLSVGIVLFSLLILYFLIAGVV